MDYIIIMLTIAHHPGVRLQSRETQMDQDAKQLQEDLQAVVNEYIRRGYTVWPDGEVRDHEGDLVEVLEWPIGMSINLGRVPPVEALH